MEWNKHGIIIYPRYKRHDMQTNEIIEHLYLLQRTEYINSGLTCK